MKVSIDFTVEELNAISAALLFYGRNIQTHGTVSIINLLVRVDDIIESNQ